MNSELKIRAIVLISMVFLLVSFLSIHGTLTSGFHFVDDHEIIQINTDFLNSNGNVLHVITNWVKNDLIGRFRPMYMVSNVITYTLFRGDFFLISLFHAIIVALIGFLLFLSLRKIGFSLLESLLFPAITLIGDQSAIWWRLGPNEFIGMWCLSLTIITMIYAIKSNRNKILFRVLFTLFATLTLLCKESFLILTPAILLTYISLIRLETKNTYQFILRKYFPELLVLFFVFSVSVIYILIYVNTESLGYAGIKDVKLEMYHKAFNRLFEKGGIGIVSFSLFSISNIISYFWAKDKRDTFLKHRLIFQIAFLFILSQVFLYAKSGVFERYFLPGMLAWALMLSYSLHNIGKIIKNKLSQKYYFIYQLLTIVLIFSLLIPRIIDVSKNATTFTKEGKEVNNVLSFISKNANPKLCLLFIADPISDYERTFSFKRYLLGISGIKKMYTYSVVPSYTNSFDKYLVQTFTNDFNTLQNKDSIDMIVVLPFLKEKGDSIASNLGYKLKEFNLFNRGNYVVYIRNKN